MKPGLIYLDHAAATPTDERVIAAMRPFMDELFFNPSSPYAPAIEVRRAYEAAKATIAGCIGVKADEIVMTAGATESINLLFGSLSGHVVTTTIEHQSVLEAAKKHDATLVAVNEKGRVAPERVAEAVRPDTVLVSVALANNELGTIQLLRQIAEKLDTIRRQRREAGNATPLVFHSDASQGVGQIDVNVARLGVDALTLNAGKIYGPKQVGLLWASRLVQLTPQIVGGGQERGLRSGTENVAGTVGFAAAMELAARHRKSEAERLEKLRDRLEQALLEAHPDAVVSGDRKHRLPGHAHISFPGVDAERVLFRLETDDILVATGSACAANKGTRSHVLEAIGLAAEIADGSLRLTLGRLNDEAQIARAAAAIAAAVRQEKERVAV